MPRRIHMVHTTCPACKQSAILRNLWDDRPDDYLCSMCMQVVNYGDTGHILFGWGERGEYATGFLIEVDVTLERSVITVEKT